MPWTLLAFLKDSAPAFIAGAILGVCGFYGYETEILQKDLVDRGTYLTKDQVSKDWVESSAYERCVKVNGDWQVSFKDLQGRGCDAALIKQRDSLWQNCSVVSERNDINNQISSLQREIDGLLDDYRGTVDPSSAVGIKVAQRRERISQKQNELQVLDGKLQ
ncbi:hypothetical protein [Burkholderia stagnalis]|uniref:hypothetical protein n=1 Tax=Burkholderia stagnalis TaxID=1503054 RepID=UPI000F80DFA0|nr:hypothetical protein [Burkholderia stagnalis]